MPMLSNEATTPSASVLSAAMPAWRRIRVLAASARRTRGAAISAAEAATPL